MPRPRFADAQQRFVSAFPAPALSMRIALATRVAACWRSRCVPPSTSRRPTRARWTAMRCATPISAPAARCASSSAAMPASAAAAGRGRRLFTGSLLPAAADTVIMQEQARAG